jgi:hypothetical protein
MTPSPCGFLVALPSFPPVTHVISMPWPHLQPPPCHLPSLCGLEHSYAYGHVNGACAITGGVFYTPPAGVPAYPGYSGAYFFLDYCAQWIRCLTFPNGPNAAPVMAPFASSLSGLLVGLAVSPVDGALYYLSYSTDTVHKIQFSGAPTVVTNPRGLSGVPPSAPPPPACVGGPCMSIHSCPCVCTPFCHLLCWQAAA